MKESRKIPALFHLTGCVTHTPAPQSLPCPQKILPYFTAIPIFPAGSHKNRLFSPQVVFFQMLYWKTPQKTLFHLVVLALNHPDFPRRQSQKSYDFPARGVLSVTRSKHHKNNLFSRFGFLKSV